MSLVLRHRPEKIGLTLDAQGWARVDDLIAGSRQGAVRLSRELIRAVVEQNDKQRFVLSEDGSKIRANQGHSVAIDLGLDPREPPDVLFHGTATRFVESIRAHGLVRGNRNHVHLSLDEDTARRVGQRHGTPAILRVRAGEMWRAGVPFYCSENGVWLAETVPTEYIDFPTP